MVFGDPNPDYHFAIWDPTPCTDYPTAGHIIHLTDSECPQGKGWVGRHTIEFYLTHLRDAGEIAYCFATPLESAEFRTAFLTTVRNVHSQYLPFAMPTHAANPESYQQIISEPKSLATIFPQGMMCWHFILACMQATMIQQQNTLLPLQPLTASAGNYCQWINKGGAPLKHTIELPDLKITVKTLTAQINYYNQREASAKTARTAAPPPSSNRDRIPTRWAKRIFRYA